jgi:hypothetical protein
MMLNVVIAPQAQIKPVPQGLPALERAISAFAPDVAPGDDCREGGNWPKVMNVNAVYRGNLGGGPHFAVWLKVCYDGDERGHSWGMMRYLRDDICKQCLSPTEHTYAHAVCVRVFKKTDDGDVIVVVAGPVTKTTARLSKPWVEFDFSVAKKTVRYRNGAAGTPATCAAQGAPDPQLFPGVFQHGEVNLP